MSFVAHWHKEIEIMYVLEGELGVGINRDYRVLSPGEMSICAKNDIHYYNSDGLRSKTVMIIFDPSVLNTREMGMDSIFICSSFLPEAKNSDDRSAIESLMLSAVAERLAKNSMYMQLLKFKLNELFLLIFRNNRSI